MNRKLLIPLLVHASAAILWLGLGSHSSKAQSNGSWKTLADVTYRTKKDPTGQYDIQYPIFGDEVKKIDGKKIELKGYMVPLDEMLGQKYFVLSSLPFNICFFCGGAGPETVIEVFSKNDIPFTDEGIRVRGTFVLNGHDPENLMYILRDAEIVD